MTDEKFPNVTPILKPLRKPPASISWGPNFSQMEELGVNSQYVNAFRLQTMQLEAKENELEQLRQEHDELSRLFKALTQEHEMATAEIDRLSRLKAELQRALSGK